MCSIAPFAVAQITGVAQGMAVVSMAVLRLHIRHPSTAMRVPEKESQPIPPIQQLSGSALSEAERADTQAFIREVLQILPLVGLLAFEKPRPVATPQAVQPVGTSATERPQLDTVIVPAQQEGFEEVFLGENCWYAIRISGGMLPKIKYIAAYRTYPESKITHYAPVASIEPYGEEGKYKLNFSEPAKPIGPIPFANAPSGSMQGPRYTSISKLQTATKLTDLF